MAYTGQILDGYKDCAIVKADNYNAAQVFVVGTAVTWDTTNRRWILATAVADEEIGFCIDESAVTGSDVAASGKLPVLVKNAWVATNQFDDAAGNLYTVLVGDVGSFVQVSPTTAGRWELLAPGAGETYAGTIRDVITVNGITMGVFDFEPRLFR